MPPPPPQRGYAVVSPHHHHTCSQRHHAPPSIPSPTSPAPHAHPLHAALHTSCHVPPPAAHLVVPPLSSLTCSAPAPNVTCNCRWPGDRSRRLGDAVVVDDWGIKLGGGSASGEQQQCQHGCRSRTVVVLTAHLCSKAGQDYHANTMSQDRDHSGVSTHLDQLHTHTHTTQKQQRKTNMPRTACEW
ncbi:hypothetical protein Hypma_010428 [Hypsizygus marmoreus]|uniref:Uncharacterized protein n=1 Tax=Hypsizygus marmoreus TaxID=39966 RepID=A0A369KH06_HYPMA|nr:hypothetical protein Hypma_010428 [Hypsizygus marmoreus]